MTEIDNFSIYVSMSVTLIRHFAVPAAYANGAH